MIPEDGNRKNYRYGPYEGHELRRQRRLQDDLGIEPAVAETILRLHSQVIALQSHVRQLEAALSSQNATENMRMAAYREVYFEGIWVELEIQE